MGNCSAAEKKSFTIVLEGYSLLLQMRFASFLLFLVAVINWAETKPQWTMAKMKGNTVPGFGPFMPQSLKLIVNIKPIADGADDEPEPLSRGPNAELYHKPMGSKQDQDSPASNPELVDRKKSFPLPPLKEWPNLPDEELRELVRTIFFLSNLKPEDLKKLTTELEKRLGWNLYASLKGRMGKHLGELRREQYEKLSSQEKEEWRKFGPKLKSRMDGEDDLDCINWSTRQLFIGDYC